MSEQFPTYRVDVVFNGPAPARRVACASGVSDVQGRGSAIRCRVQGSFQPFLDSLRGYEVLRLESAMSLDRDSNSRLEEGNAGKV